VTNYFGWRSEKLHIISTITEVSTISKKAKIKDNYDFAWYRLANKGKIHMAQKREIAQGQAQNEQHKKQVNEQEARNKIFRVTEQQLTNRKFTFND
jgi:hypothetical protein